MFARACHVATGGNPLLLVELDKALRADGVEPVAADVAAVDRSRRGRHRAPCWCGSGA